MPSLIITLLKKLYVSTNKSQNFNLSIARYFLAVVGILLEYPDHQGVSG